MRFTSGHYNFLLYKMRKHDNQVYVYVHENGNLKVSVVEPDKKHIIVKRYHSKIIIYDNDVIHTTIKSLLSYTIKQILKEN